MKTRYKILSIIGITVCSLLILDIVLDDNRFLTHAFRAGHPVLIPSIIIQIIQNEGNGIICLDACGPCSSYGYNYVLVEGECKIPDKLEDCYYISPPMEWVFIDNKCVPDSNFAGKEARISIEGLKEEYRQGESIEFTIQAHGFSIGCESVRVMVFHEYKTQPPLYEKEFVAECKPNSKPTQTDYAFPILINQLNNGKSEKYVVVASYYQHRGSFGDIEQNFIISS